MRNKFLIILFLGFIWQTTLFAQLLPSIEDKWADEQKEKIAKIEQTVNSTPSDTTNRKVVLFNEDFRKKYLNDDEFVYNQDEGEKTFIARFWEKLQRFLKKLLGMGSSDKISDINLIIIKIISGLIILIVIYFIVRLLMRHKGNWFFQKKNESIPIDINDTEQLIKLADFEQLIAEIESQGNSRQSIRLYYLWLLKDLKEKELIVWLPEKTNADYMSELKDESLRKQFSYLSYLYNYIWYGEFAINAEDYINAKSAFLSYLGKEPYNG